MATLTDVARLAGVSLATASRVLNGSERKVRPDYRNRVLAAAEQLRYLPDSSAQAMAKGRSKMVGLIVNDVLDPYYTGILAGVSQATSQAGGVLTLAAVGIQAARRQEVIAMMHSHRARALILAGGMHLDLGELTAIRADLQVLHKQVGTGVVSIGQPGLGVPTLNLQNAAAAADLAGHLLDQGYRRIGVLTGPRMHYTSAERVRGFREAVLLGGGMVTEVEGAIGWEGGYSAVEEVLRSDPEAIFAVTDMTALGALGRLRELDVMVPDDVALAGFGDVRTLRNVVPALTTVHIDLPAMGRRAFELSQQSHDPDLVEDVPYQLIVRDSTPALK